MKAILFRHNFAEKDAWGGFMIITFPVKFYEMSQKNKSREPRAMS